MTKKNQKFLLFGALGIGALLYFGKEKKKKEIAKKVVAGAVAEAAAEVQKEQGDYIAIGNW